MSLYGSSSRSIDVIYWSDEYLPAGSWVEVYVIEFAHVHDEFSCVWAEGDIESGKLVVYADGDDGIAQGMGGGSVEEGFIDVKY